MHTVYQNESGKQRLQCIDQCRTFGIRTNRDTQELVDARLLEVADQDRPLAQAGGNHRGLSRSHRSLIWEDDRVSVTRSEEVSDLWVTLSLSLVLRVIVRR